MASPNAAPLYFIVGNSRSGTTMMLRILNNHPDIYALNELHFFENLWSSADGERTVEREEAISIASSLLFIQREGYIGKTDTAFYREEASEIVDSLNMKSVSGPQVYDAMMRYETAKHDRSIPVEKTPQNVFYLKDIFHHFPQARIINLVRDPRAVMLSQKRKWRRRKMGADFITPWEVFRLRVNYHPITISKLWNAAIKASTEFESDERMLTVRFEDLLEKPEQTVQAIAKHINVPYSDRMLDIPQASSSNEADSQARGINKDRAGNWRNGGLNRAEIYYCERICAEYLRAHDYELTGYKPNPLSRILYVVSFPFKIGLALLININRMKNIGETIRKRLQ